MRLFLLPISRKRILLYCDKIYPKPALTSSSTQTGNPINPAPASLREVFFPPKPPPSASSSSQDSATPVQSESTILDRATDFAAATWTSWEREPKGWQKRITVLGNTLLRRIPFEEWALKSVPPFTGRRKTDYEKLFSADSGISEAEKLKLREKKVVKVLFPPNGERYGGMRAQDVKNTLERLATERQDLHRTRMIGSLIGAPLTLPFALVPVIPNIPGFYLLFRAWSHWRAWNGAKTLQFLVEKDLVEPVGDDRLGKVYERAIERMANKQLEGPVNPVKSSVGEDTETTIEADKMLLDMPSSDEISECFGIPEMDVEIERAIEQVEQKLRKNDEVNKEKTA